MAGAPGAFASPVIFRSSAEMGCQSSPALTEDVGLLNTAIRHNVRIKTAALNGHQRPPRKLEFEMDYGNRRMLGNNGRAVSEKGMAMAKSSKLGT
jgi:hypothetical protein